MANTQIFAYLIMFVVIFSGILTLYGSSQPGFSNAINAPNQCLINNVPPDTCSYPVWNPPTPTNVTVLKGQVPWYLCILNVPCVIGSVVGISSPSTAQSIWNGMSELAYAVGLVPQYAFVFFNKIGAGIFLIGGIASFLNQDQGVPFLGYLFTAFLILIGVFLVAMVKPGGHGN